MMHPTLFRASAWLGLFLLIALPHSVHAQQATPAPISAPTPLPTPAVAMTPLPYPAYGTPAPDVMAQSERPGVPVSVTLTQAIDIAAAQSPAFATQRAQYDAVRAKYGSEKGAALPNVGVTADLNRNYSQTITTGSGANVATTTIATTLLETHATATQLIYDGGRVIAGIRSAKESDLAGRQTLLRQLQTLAFNVSTAYYGVLQAQATVDADASLVRQFESQEENTRAQIRTGAAARSDLAAAQFQTAQARGNLITAQGAVIGAQATFATTLGLDADANINPQTTPSTKPVRTLSYPNSLKQALALRPDYLSAEHTVESAKENLRFSKLARFPVLSINGTDGYSRELPFQQAYQKDKALGATFTLPIYDQGLTNFNVATAASQLDQANATLVLTKLTVESDVRGALSNVISARAALVQAQAEFQSAQVTLQATQAQYKVGASTITAIITAEANLATAQRDEITAVYNELLGEERYNFALGTSDLRL